MQAVVQTRYGAPDDVLTLGEIARPTVDGDQVLVRVHAAGLNVGDCFGVRGSPVPMRLASGLRNPRHPVPGYDLAGEVVAVGPGVTRFRPGDAVYGVGRETWAEYARVNQARLAPKPANLTFVGAAAVPVAAQTALHGLRDAGRLRAGQRVLVNGAAGGVGTFAVQIARALGAEVTGVCRTANVDLVRALGADHVIDYTREDFTRGGPRYDLILDNVENHPLAAVRRALLPGGTLVLNSGTGAQGLKMLTRMVAPIVVSPFAGQRLRRFLSAPNQADLAVIGELIEAGAVRPVVDRAYALAEAASAVRHVEGGHARGKVVIAVAA